MSKVDVGFWKNRRVLVTGHTGFKGAWLSLLLKALDANVFGISRVPHTQPNLFSMLGFQNWGTSYFENIVDRKAVSEVFSTVKPDVVFHLAAQSIVRTSYEEPENTVDSNIIGTFNILNIARRHSSPSAIIVVTSDKCYANENVTKAFDETDKLGGDDTYSASKACAELITHAMRSSFFSSGTTAVSTCRAGNVIGGGDFNDFRICVDAYKALVSSQVLELRMPDAVRPWQHVLDPLMGYIFVAQHTVQHHVPGDAWNFGPLPDEARTVADLCEEFQRHWPENHGWQCNEAYSGPKEMHFLTVDSSKAKRELGWRPMLAFDEAVQWTSEWYRAFYLGGSAEAFVHTERQVAEFIKMHGVTETSSIP